MRDVRPRYSVQRPLLRATQGPHSEPISPVSVVMGSVDPDHQTARPTPALHINQLPPQLQEKQSHHLPLVGSHQVQQAVQHAQPINALPPMAVPALQQPGVQVLAQPMEEQPVQLIQSMQVDSTAPQPAGPNTRDVEEGEVPAMEPEEEWEYNLTDEELNAPTEEFDWGV